MKLIAIITSLLAISLLWLMHESRASSDSVAVADRHETVGAAHAVATRSIPTPSIASPSMPTPAPAPEEDVTELRGRRLQDRFDAERIDASWAATARQEVHDDLDRSTGDDVQLQDVECRASLCRADVTFTKRGAGTSFMQKWLHSRTWTGPGFAETRATDHPEALQHMVVFLGKPGADL